MNDSLEESIPKNKTKIRKIGPYMLIKPIGKGTFSTVYEGKMQQYKKKLAIKQISLANVKTKDMERIQLQINILSMIRHQNIVRLLDFKKSSRHLYLIFEHCQHTDLQKHIEKYYNGRMPEDNVRKIFIQIKKAFEVLRAHRIVHRDLKLANLLVTEDFKIKIGDFGFAKHLQDNQLFKSVVGTPLTMAPEILSKRDYNQKCDIWSLGIILYQMLIGRSPFVSPDNMTLKGLVEGINTKKIEFTEQIPLSKEVKDLIMRMVVKDSSKRMSFQEFFKHKWLEENSRANMTLELRDMILEKEVNKFAETLKTGKNQIIEISKYLDKILIYKLFSFVKNHIENKVYNYINLAKKIFALGQTEPNSKKVCWLGILLISNNLKAVDQQPIEVYINELKVILPNWSWFKSIKIKEQSEFSKGLEIIVSKNHSSIKTNIKKMIIENKMLSQLSNSSELVLERYLTSLIQYLGQPKINKQLLSHLSRVRIHQNSTKIVLSSQYLSREILCILNKPLTWEQLKTMETLLSNDSELVKIYRVKEKIFKFDLKNEVDQKRKNIDRFYQFIKQMM